MSNFIAVAKTTDLKPGQMKSFAVGDKGVLLANWEGTLFATEDLCTHDDGTLADGELVEGQIECPRHGGQFDLKTGRGTLPAVMPIKTFSVKVEGDNILVALE